MGSKLAELARTVFAARPEWRPHSGEAVSGTPDWLLNAGVEAARDGRGAVVVLLARAAELAGDHNAPGLVRAGGRGQFRQMVVRFPSEAAARAAIAAGVRELDPGRDAREKAERDARDAREVAAASHRARHLAELRAKLGDRWGDLERAGWRVEDAFLGVFAREPAVGSFQRRSLTWEDGDPVWRDLYNVAFPFGE